MLTVCRAPYSYAITNSSGKTTGPANTLSKGIWKSVYLTEAPAATVVITHLTPHTRYMGDYPTAPLQDGKHGGFHVNVTAHLWAPAGGATGSITATGSWDFTASSGEIEMPAGESRVSLQLLATASQIKLWWPTGVGPQPLFNVSATWTATPGPATHQVNPQVNVSAAWTATPGPSISNSYVAPFFFPKWLASKIWICPST